MFGISFIELIIVLVFAIILINPKEYKEIFRFISNLHRHLKFIYQDCVNEIDSIKSTANLEEIKDNIEKEIDDAEEQIQKIVGDDGKLYDSYDISDMLKENEAKKQK